MAHAEAVADAKRLMRMSRTAALATLDPATGAPLTTLVGVANDFDGAPLFLMSTLARHTKHLAFDPRASVLLTEEPDRAYLLNHPRITLNGRIERATEPGARTRYLQRNSKAKLYADFADFAFFRLAIDKFHFNGGFGRADALAPGRYSDFAGRRGGAFPEAEARLIDRVKAPGIPQSPNSLDTSTLAATSVARSASTRKAWTSPPAGAAARAPVRRTGAR